MNYSKVSSPLSDKYGRHMRKLRVSLLEACNLRCLYCMPLKPQFMSPSNYLEPEQIINICEQMVSFGVEQIRVTGGEPTIRKEFKEIMLGLSKLNLEKLSITSNGLLLEEHLPLLKQVNCNHINISLDSLNEDRFNQLTRSQGFQKVFRSIIRAKDMGFEVKINTVVMFGKNHDELLDFVRFAEQTAIEVRFLELMKIGEANQFQGNTFMTADQMIQVIEAETALKPKSVEKDSTSFNFTTPKGGQIGFIASESKPFCGSCSRLRLSADGYLRACLMSDKGLSLKNIAPEEMNNVLMRVIGMKPYERIVSIDQAMHQIGG